MSPVTVKTARWALLLLAFALGVVVGAVGSFEHRVTATVFGSAWPTGLVLSLFGQIGLLQGLSALLEPPDPDGGFAAGPNAVPGAGAGAAPYGPRSWRPTRLSAVGWAATGWLIALLWLTYLGPPPGAANKGDVILANDWRSMAFLFIGMVMAAVAVYRAWAATLTARLAVRPGAPERTHSKG
jgi:hypothetical protein